jgi:adenosylcobinamide-GDP ribazoletransferase
MKDSRIGAFGAVAVCLCLMLKTALTAQLMAGSPIAALVIAPVMGRTVMTLAVFVFPAARKTGLGGSFKAHCRVGDAIICACAAVAAAVILRGLWGLAFAAGIAAAGLGCGALLNRAFGGLTGDSYGALCEISEIIGLLVLIVLPPGGILA